MHGIQDFIIETFAATSRWGLTVHSMILAALIPIAAVIIADRRLRRLQS